MARLGTSPVFKAFDSDGSVLNAGTVETFITSTSTPKNTWSDQAETVDAATSFTLDANGEAVRYFATDAAYKLIIKDSAGATVRTIDPYVPVPNMASLDGNMDVNGNSIVSSANGDIAITPNGTGDVILDGLKWPQADGTVGQVIKTDGSAQLAFTNIASDVVNDTTPQLGGDLDTNAFNITFDDAKGILDDSSNEQLIFQKTATAVNYLDITNAATGSSPAINAVGDDTNIDLDLVAKGTGNITISGVKYPNADGTAGQVVVTDGAGVASFGSAAVTASQAEMETATSNTVYATAGRTQHNPGVAKGYVVISTAAADLDSHNVASITDNGVGDYTINWTTDFSSANYTVTGSVFSSGLLILTIVGQAAGTTQVNILTNAGAASETGVTHVSVAALGDQ